MNEDSREQRGVNFTAGAIRQLERRLTRLEAEVRALSTDRRNAVVRKEMSDGRPPGFPRP
jgi:hypothetical protein